MSILKEKLRQELRQKRIQFVASHGTEAAEKAILEQLIFMELRPCSIAGYWSINSEVPTPNLLKWLFDHNFDVALPTPHRKSYNLEFYRWTPETHLVPGLHHTLVCPDKAEKVTPKIILLPLLGFDPFGHRLGQGGGYYDTTLEQLRAQYPITTIGLAYDSQLVHQIPQESHDQRLDYVVTPSTIWKFR